MHDLRAAIARRTGPTAPLELYRFLLFVEQRNSSRAGMAATFRDLGTRFPNDRRVPAFLLQEAQASIATANRGYVPFAQEAAKAILMYYGASAESGPARNILKDLSGRSGR